MDFDTWIEQAWNTHADAPAALAEQLLPQALPLLHKPEQAVALARLAHHLLGEHLGRFHEGLACLQRVAQAPCLHGRSDAVQAQAQAEVQAEVQTQAEAQAQARADALGALNAISRFEDALRLAAGPADPRAGRSPSERLRVGALALASLAPHDAPRAQALLDSLCAELDQAALPDTDPAVRALAAMANNAAATLAERALGESPRLDDASRSLMLHAAHVARAAWARAGTWLEVERADHRLALCALAAGDLAQARLHAAHCLHTVQAHGAPPLEAFFAWEAHARIERAALAGQHLDAGDATPRPQALAEAIAQAQAAFAQLPAEDQAWCRSSLEALG